MESKPIEDYTDSELTQALSELEEQITDRLCESADNNIPTPIATYFLHKFLATYSITIHDKEKN